MKCDKSKLSLLKTFLSDSFDFEMTNKPNGQSHYRFTNGFVLNIYETGALVFQGEHSEGAIANQIRSFVAALNGPMAD